MGRIQKMNSSLLFFSFLVVQVHLINGQLSQRLGRPNYLYGRSPVLQPPRYEVRQLTLLVISRDYFGHGPQKAFFFKPGRGEDFGQFTCFLTAQKGDFSIVQI